MSDIAEEIEALVVPKLKTEMVLGLRLMKEYQCSLVFSRGEDFLWTATREVSMVPIRHLTHRPSLPHEPGGQIKGDHNPRTDMRKRLIAKITAAVESPDEMLEGWPTSYDYHSIIVVQETKVEEYEMYGCPRPVLLDEAMRRTRGGGRTEIVAVVPEKEVDDSIGTNEQRDCDNAGRSRSDCASILLGRNSRRDERYAFIGNETYSEGPGNSVRT